MATSSAHAGRSTENQKLALLGGDPIDLPQAPQYPTFSARARERVDDLLARGRMVGLSKLDPIIAEAENALADFHGVRCCLGTSSGFAALHACLMGLEITGGDEVITTPYTWGASISPILHNNAVPVFADVDPVTGLLDPASIEARITSRTRAILAVHIYGQPADMHAIRAVADRHGLAVIEDGSQAHGARHRGQRIGGFGDAAGFSCMGAKLLATSEAGYLVTNEERVYYNAALSTQHMGGTVNDSGRAAEPGFPADLAPFSDSLISTYRLSTINAVLLTEQLTTLDDELAGRGVNVAVLRDELAGVKSITMPTYPDGDVPAYYALTFTFDAEHAGVSRDTYLAALSAEGLEAEVYIRHPIHRWPRLQPRSGAPRTLWDQMIEQRSVAYADDDLPNAEQKAAYSVEIDWQRRCAPDPIGVRRIAAAIQKVEENLAELRVHERSTAER